MDIDKFLSKLCEKYPTKINEGYFELNIKSNIIKIYKDEKRYEIPGIKCNHMRIYDLNKSENYSVLMLLVSLFDKGYSKEVITLEKEWILGHKEKGSLDIEIKNPNDGSIYMIEVKDLKELKKYADPNNKHIYQLFSYAFQEKNTKVMSYYSYDFKNNTHHFKNIYLDTLLTDALNVEDLFNRWNKLFDQNNYILDNPVFNI